ELSEFLAELANPSRSVSQAPAPSEKSASPAAGVSIEFSASGNSDAYCSTGWSAPEERWQWAIGPEARMLVPRPDRPGNYLLTVKLRPFLAKPQLARQRLTIEVNGAPLASFEAGNPEPAVRSCLVPSGVIARGRDLAITFRTPDAARPADFGLSDTRQLSFAFHMLTLTPAGEDRSRPGSDIGG